MKVKYFADISAVCVGALAIAALIGCIAPGTAWAQQDRSVLPQVLKTILDAHWKLRAALAELPPVQIEQRERLEVQDFVQHAFQGGALRLFVSPPPGGGDIFAVLADTRLSGLANFGRLSPGRRFIVAHEAPYVVIVPIRPVSRSVFAKLKSRRWTAEELQREIGAPSYHWHVHGVGWKGMTYVPEGMSFIGDTVGRDEPYRFQLVAPLDEPSQESWLLPPLSSVARINYEAMQASTRSGCSQRILQQRVQTDQALATGERSPDGRFVVGVVNFGGLRYSEEFVIRDAGKPERRFSVGEGVVDKFWLNATTMIFATAAPTDVYTFSALDPMTGESKQLANVDCSFPRQGCVSERGISQWTSRRPHAEGNAGVDQATGRGGTEEEIMKRQYLVRIDKDVDSDWGASVPDLPGCVATGKTIDVALRRIESAIELHLRGLREDGIRVPPPRQRAVRPRRTPKQVNFYATVEVAA